MTEHDFKLGELTAQIRALREDLDGMRDEVERTRREVRELRQHFDRYLFTGRGVMLALMLMLGLAVVGAREVVTMLLRRFG